MTKLKLRRQYYWAVVNKEGADITEWSHKSIYFSRDNCICAVFSTKSEAIAFNNSWQGNNESHIVKRVKIVLE